MADANRSREYASGDKFSDIADRRYISDGFRFPAHPIPAGGCAMILMVGLE
jgi:hypothetical protein